MSLRLPDQLPSLRVLLPLAGGIWLCDGIGRDSATVVAVALAAVAIVMLAAVALLKPSAATIRLKRAVRPVPVVCLAAALGMALMAQQLPRPLDMRPDELVAARIERLTVKERSMTLEATIIAARHTSRAVGQRVIIYTSGCDYTLDAGDVVAFPQAFTAITGDGNPGAFDYGAHFRHRGIGSRQFIAADRLVHMGTFDTFFTMVERHRRAAEHSVMALDGLSPDARRLVIALALGNDDYIDPEMRDEFAAAGIAHVLALSGLHIAILAMLTMLLLYPLDYYGHKKTRLLLTLAVIIAYAVFTGLSPSVVRAAIMTAVVTWAFYVYRKTTIGDALCLSALLTLAFRPGDLFSAGFWMSYLSVTAIAVTSATILPRLKTRWAVVNYFVGIVVVSVAAMVATAPVTVHCFNSVAPLGMMANVVVLPLFPVLMVACMLAAAVAAAGIEWLWLDAVVNAGNQAITWVAHGVARLCGGGSHTMYMDFTTTLLCVAALLLALLWLVWRQRRHLVAASLVLATAFAMHLHHIASVPASGLIMLNDSRFTPVIAYSGDSAVVWTPFDTRLDPAQFLRRQRNLLAALGVDRVAIRPDTAADGRLIRMELATAGARRLLALGGGHWRDRRLAQADSAARRHVDYLIATRRFHGPLEAAARFVTFDTLVISGNVYADSRAALIAACDSLRIPCIDLAEAGALCR